MAGVAFFLSAALVLLPPRPTRQPSKNSTENRFSWCSGPELERTANFDNQEETATVTRSVGGQRYRWATHSSKLIAQVHLFTPDAQFVTTVIGSDSVDSRGTLTRNRWPLSAT